MGHGGRSTASVALASTPDVKLESLMLQPHALRNAYISQGIDVDMRGTAIERREQSECGGGIMGDRGYVHG